MYYHIILTDHCNLACTYCRGRTPVFPSRQEEEGPEIDLELPPEPGYEPELLYRFLERDPDASLIFYGGEPLLRPDLVSEMVRHAPARRFLLQTNGLLLDGIPRGVLSRIDSLLVSIDGDREVTDRSRGEGTYRRVMENLRRAVRKGYRGEIIARMTVARGTDIASAVRFLSDNPDFSFRSIHWQLDADLSSGNGDDRDFVSWADRTYNPGVLSLIDDWVGCMEAGGGVRRWYPFIDPLEDLLAGRESPLRCGAGHANFTIMTDGSIGPCPCMVGLKDFYLGHIGSSDPGELPMETPPGSLCPECAIRSFCGGRCLYARILCPWPEDMQRVVCGTVENLHRGLTGVLPRMRDLLGRGTIGMEDLTHPRYNGCEIIP